MIASVLGKGGSGKTTSTVALGDEVARQTGLRVTLIDLDAQASLTSWLVPNLPADHLTIDDALTGAATAETICQQLRGDLAVLPASNGLAAVEPSLRPDALEQLLRTLPADVVLIDTPAIRPLGPGAVILRSVLAAADVVVAPFRSTVVDLDALDETLSQVEAHVETTKHRLPTLLLPTMTTRDGSSELVVRALRLGGLQVLAPVPASPWAAKAAAARGLLAERAPASAPIVAAYAAAAADLLPLLTAARSVVR